MKIKLLWFAFLLSFIGVKAQISNLSELASGEIQLFSPIIDLNDALYGYFTLSKLEKLTENEERYEYVILDKNLNKVANGEFVDIRYKNIFSDYFRLEKVGNKLIITKIYYNNFKRLYVLDRLIDLEKNTVSTPFYLNNGTIVDGFREKEKLAKKLRTYPLLEFPVAIKDGFMIFETVKPVIKKYRKKLASLSAYTLDYKKKWEYTYRNDNYKGKIDKVINTITDDCAIFTFTNLSIKNKQKMVHSINTITGKRNFSYEIENKKSPYNHVYSVRKLKNKTIIVGKYSPYSQFGYNYKKALGLFKIELDNDGNELSKKYFKWADAGEFLEMDELGRLEGRYRLHAKSYFIFKNGKITILTEKLKENYNIIVGSVVKTENFVLLEFDENFKLTKVETLEKDKSKWFTSDYLFSQYIKDGEGVVFFYRNLKKEEGTKKKNWILGIVSLMDGKLNHEKIPMSSEDFFIRPYIAKEGYILLREYNKDSDYDQIRLERLNYD